MAYANFLKATGIMISFEDFEKIITDFPEDAKTYFDNRNKIVQEILESSDDFIADGHHPECECGCLEMTSEERYEIVANKISDKQEQRSIISGCIDGYVEIIDVIGGIFDVVVNTVMGEIVYGGIDAGKVFIGCTEFLREQTEDDYDMCGDDIDRLIDKASRTKFKLSDYPEFTDSNDIDELKISHVGEPIDISVPISEKHQDILSKYGEIKDYCLYRLYD